jgi:hypothetical protein
MESTATATAAYVTSAGRPDVTSSVAVTVFAGAFEVTVVVCVWAAWVVVAVLVKVWVVA